MVYLLIYLSFYMFLEEFIIYHKINNVMKEKDIKRFEKKIIKTETCHFWTAGKTRQGYGMFSFNGKSIPAHRFAYIAYKGEILNDKIVHQTCNNTYCVNPNHLILKNKSDTRKNYYDIRINKEMIFNESIRYLEKLKKIRPDIKNDIEKIIEKINKPEIVIIDSFNIE